MGLRALAAAAAMAVCAWAGSTSAATVDVPVHPGGPLNFLDLAVGDSGHFTGYRQSFGGGNWHFDIPVGATIHIAVDIDDSLAGKISNFHLLLFRYGNFIELQNYQITSANDQSLTFFNHGYGVDGLQFGARTLPDKPLVSPFEITYSVDLAAPAPEPATWALMLLGFAGLAARRLLSRHGGRSARHATASPTPAA